MSYDNYQGEKFILKTYNDLFKYVKQHNNYGNKYEIMKSYFIEQEQKHNNILEKGKINLLKKYYYRKYVIKKEEIPNSYIGYLNKISYDTNGRYLTEEEIEEKKDQIVENQKQSLNTWIDYLLSEDSRFFPWWSKYWAFKGMLSIGSFDSVKMKYNKRSNNTVAPYTELNIEVLSKCINLVTKECNELPNEELNELVNNGSFFKLYTLLMVKQKKSLNNKDIDGIWKKYPQGSNYKDLFNSLQGQCTGWCTVGEETCKNQLENGDFYVYYTYDKHNNPIIPRIAIRMDGDYEIGEIRGIGQNQNIEPNFENILEKKLEEFDDGKRYIIRVENIKKTTMLYEKYKNNIDFNTKDLKDLYFLKNNKYEFGWRKDPRITEMIDSRNEYDDYAKIYKLSPEEIGLTLKDLKSPKIKTYIGDIELDTLSSCKMKFPKRVIGNVSLSNLLDAKDLVLPEYIDGDLNLEKLEDASDLVFPKKVGGVLKLNNIVSGKNVIFPDKVNTLILSNITDTNKLVLPNEIRELVLDKITNIGNLIIPESVKVLYLCGITTDENLVLPNNLEELELGNIEYIKDLKLPESLKCLYMDGLKSDNNLILPKNLEYLYLDSLTKIENLIFPDNMMELSLDSLKESENITFPKSIKVSLFLNELENINYEKIPNDLHFLVLNGKMYERNQIVELKNDINNRGVR